ncbi:MAG TPA: DeoR/GlpR family DNA-binding transcription regulator [Firmicutes bacterium]|nr:DeoR/GlpR family DNA-binding transcription regulator [Bacillota bacterium]
MAAEPMFAEERQNQILQLLRRQKKLLVSELCDTFGVSPATIRNDLNDLERQGLLRRTHGGAIAGTKINFEPTSVEKDVANREQKMAIGQAAAELVEEGDTIAVDTGTTTYYLAQALSGKSRLTVVTPDLVIARTLEDYAGVSVILAGGQVRKGFSCTVGAITNGVLQSLAVDKVFLATNSVSAAGELCTPDIEQAEVKKNLRRMGNQVILLCDSSKFGTQSFAKFGELQDLDMVITDRRADPETLQRLRAMEIAVEAV